MAKVMSKGEKLDHIVRELAKLQKQIKVLSQQQTKLGEDVIRLTKVAAGSPVVRSTPAARPRPAAKAKPSQPTQKDVTP